MNACTPRRVSCFIRGWNQSQWWGAHFNLSLTRSILFLSYLLVRMDKKGMESNNGCPIGANCARVYNLVAAILRVVLETTVIYAQSNFDVLIDLRPYIITFSLGKLPIVWFTSKLVSDPQRLFQISMDCSIDTSLIPSKIDNKTLLGTALHAFLTWSFSYNWVSHLRFTARKSNIFSWCMAQHYGVKCSTVQFS